MKYAICASESGAHVLSYIAIRDISTDSKQIHVGEIYVQKHGMDRISPCRCLCLL